MKNWSVDELLEREMDPAFERRAGLILTHLELKTGREKVLDLGCGRGFYANSLGQMYPNLQITGVDRSEKYLMQAKLAGSKNVTWRTGDATKLNFKNNSFDRVVCSEVLEHIPNDQAAIAEMYRVLKKGGRALISVPFVNYPINWDPINWLLERAVGKHVPANIWWLAGIWADHVRLYGEQEVLDKLQKTGFKVTDFWRATRWAFPFSHFLLYGIGKNLVERGLVKSADRFNYQVKPGSLMRGIKLMFGIWDKLNNVFEPVEGKPYLNIVVSAEKR